MFLFYFCVRRAECLSRVFERQMTDSFILLVLNTCIVPLGAGVLAVVLLFLACHAKKSFPLFVNLPMFSSLSALDVLLSLRFS